MVDGSGASMQCSKSSLDTSNGRDSQALVVENGTDGNDDTKMIDSAEHIPNGNLEASPIDRSKRTTFKEIAKEIMPTFQIAWPIGLSGAMLFIVPIISLSFVGQLGKIELASIGLATAFSNIVGMSLIHGASIACDTLCSQAFGAGNYKRVGMLVQRGILFNGCMMLPIAALWLNSEKILLLLGQEPAVARLVQEFLTYFLPTPIFVIGYVMIGKIITCQGIVKPLIVSCAGASVVNVISNYLLVDRAGLGIRGGAISSAIANFAMVLILTLIIKCRSYHRNVWHGWSWECLEEWGQFASLAVPSLLSVMVEWGSYEIGAIVLGLVSETDVAVQSILVGVVGLVFQIPYGLEVALCIRIANFLGAGDVRQAKIVMKAGLMVQAALGVICAVTFFSLKDYIGRIFSSNSDVLELTSKTVPVAAASMFFDGMQAVSAGGIKGLGLLKYAAITNFISYDILALPVGCVLALKTYLHVRGFWIGMGIGAVAQFSLLLAFLLRVNWKSHSRKARRRAGVTISLGNLAAKKNDIASSRLLEPSETEDDSLKDKAEDVVADDVKPASKEEDNVIVLSASEGTGGKPSLRIMLRRLLVLGICALMLIAGIVTRFLI